MKTNKKTPRSDTGKDNLEKNKDGALKNAEKNEKAGEKMGIDRRWNSPGDLRKLAVNQV